MDMFLTLLHLTEKNLSEKVPLNEAEGVCIGYAHRENDDDDKLIVIKEGEKYTNEEIMKLIHFQEQWFKTKIIL